MENINRMHLGNYEFVVETAWFRYITQSWSGPGWDFMYKGKCLNDNVEIPKFPYGFTLRTEAAPLPLAKTSDYTGREVILNSAYHEESGEPFFGLNVWEEHDLPQLKLHFVQREGSRYLISINATVAKTIFGHPEQLTLVAWTEEFPDHAYPK